MTAGPRCALQLQVLKELHANGHHLGAIRPERIVVHPEFHMLDLAPGMVTARHVLMLLWLINSGMTCGVTTEQTSAT